MQTKPITAQQQTDSGLLIPYEHIVTKNKNNTDIVYLNVAAKNISETTENNNYIFAW